MAMEFPYVTRDPRTGDASRMPYLPITLSANGNRIDVSALVDSGATINVLPQTVGRALGFVWDQQTVTVRLAGSLGRVDAKAVAVQASVGDFEDTTLAFAWSADDVTPVILGQMNFFEEYAVCFFRHRGTFEVKPR